MGRVNAGLKQSVFALATLLVCFDFLGPSLAAASGTPVTCDVLISAKLTIDQGHPWRPPFGLDRVGSPLIAHIEIASERAPRAKYHLVTYQASGLLKRQELQPSINPSNYGGFSPSLVDANAGKRFAHVLLSPEATEAALESQCGQRTAVLDRQTIRRPALEAGATARPQHHINPIDLGVILPPQDELLMRKGESAIVEFATLSNAKEPSFGRLSVWFEGEKALQKPLSLVKGKRVSESMTLPLTRTSEKTTLHVRLRDEHEKELFSKDIGVIVAEEDRSWPAFGAVETRLRYDAPILTFDPRTGAAREPIAYRVGWKENLKDLVILLPNGSRFVFWRGAHYIPFWGGRYNTGTVYQWAEDCNHMITHPDGIQDCPEPIFDSELRFSRIRLMESTPARIHVRWDYQPTDVQYEYQAGRATEDFYFYPDGFGTRVVTLAAPPQAGPPQLSEFILINPPSAYPLEVLPKHPLEAISLKSGRKDRFRFPYPQTLPSDPEASSTRMAQLPLSDKSAILYRVFSHRDDRASAIYLPFNNRTDIPALTPHAFPPIYDRGEIVSPIYWGNHWPLTRGKWTGYTISDQISAGPSHGSLAVWIPVNFETLKPQFEVPPLQQGQWEMPDCTAQDRVCTVSRLAWMIGQTDLPDRDVIEQAQSYLHPPVLTVIGGRLSIPSYSPERRALRMVAESPSIDIEIKSQYATVNPVFEIEAAPQQLTSVTLNGKPLSTGSYRWDGSTLWVAASIPVSGGKLALQFR